MSDQGKSIQEKVFIAAYAMLARRSYTEIELKKKLIQKYSNAKEEVEKTVSRLVEMHYLDDQRYAENFIRKINSKKPQGKKLLRFNLIKKGISNEVILNAISHESIDELELAKTVINKKLKLLNKFPAAKQQEKLYRFLVSRGFDLYAARTAINSIYSKRVI